MAHEGETPYAAFVRADREWREEIARAFPKEWAGDVRYTPRGEGEPGTVLREKFDAFVSARDAWHEARGATIVHRHESINAAGDDIELARDKREIIAALDYRSGPDSCNSVYLGSLAVGMICHAVGISYEDHSGLREAIRRANRKQVDMALEACAGIIAHMKARRPTERLDQQYRDEGWGRIAEQAIGVRPSFVESQAREVARYAAQRIAVLEQACGAAAVAMLLDAGSAVAAEQNSPLMMCCRAIGFDPVNEPEKIVDIVAKIRAQGPLSMPASKGGA